MCQRNVYQLIEEALNEAMILESAHDRYDESHMLKTAQRLSGADFTSVQEVFMQKRGFTRSFSDMIMSM